MVIKLECMREGLTIRGKIYTPDTLTPRPAVILCHGFLANQKMCAGYAKFLEKLGFAAVTFDFCGGGLACSSDGKSRDMTVFTEEKDLLRVIEHVKTLAYIKAEDISLLGCSQGGYVSALTAADEPGLINRLILLYPALCIPFDARKGKMMFYHFDPSCIHDTLGLLPMELGGEYARSVIDKDPFEQISGFSKPTLIIHGTNDNIVDAEYSKKAFKCYPKGELKLIEGAGHVFHGKDDAKARQFIKEFLQ